MISERTTETTRGVDKVTTEITRGVNKAIVIAVSVLLSCGVVTKIAAKNPFKNANVIMYLLPFLTKKWRISKFLLFYLSYNCIAVFCKMIILIGRLKGSYFISKEV
jgi:hypothetical protein